ncbi:MAG: quinone-dependent dihydroorotate dehydrogenase [Alphaproteobacteria bacterium]
MIDLYPLLRPLLFRCDAEQAHRLAVRALASGLVPACHGGDDPILAVTVFGHQFANPIGMAAGFDKNAEAVDGLLGLGFGFVEIGTVTPRPQAGNAKPRLFRLPADRAIINRLGFNSAGMAPVAERLAARRLAHGKGAGIVGINIGKNRDSADAAADYAAVTRALGVFADYLVINVSSPNTPGLRALQGKDELLGLVGAVRGALADTAGATGAGRRPVPVLVKIAPDLSPDERADVAAAALAAPVDGLIVSNTTVSRPDTLADPHRAETGGLSGRPLFALSTAVLRDMRRLTQGRIPLIGAGGVASGADAYAKIRAGASLVQIYSALVYEGPALVDRIKRELAGLLRRDGFATVADAVGQGGVGPDGP